MDVFLNQLDIVLANKPDKTIKLGYSDLIDYSITKVLGTTTLEAIDRLEKYIICNNVPGGVQLIGNNILSFSELDLLNSCEECKDILQGYFRYAYNVDVIVTPLNP